MYPKNEIQDVHPPAETRWLRAGFWRLSLATIVAVAWMAVAASVSAQECRIYTVVYDESGEPTSGVVDRSPQPRVLSRSLSLMHAGKVYDSIDALGEVTIFDPAERRFTILNTKHTLAASVSFDESQTICHRLG
jgi:hypothetical protein